MLCLLHRTATEVVGGGEVGFARVVRRRTMERKEEGREGRRKGSGAEKGKAEREVEVEEKRLEEVARPRVAPAR